MRLYRKFLIEAQLLRTAQCGTIIVSKFKSGFLFTHLDVKCTISILNVLYVACVPKQFELMNLTIFEHQQSYRKLKKKRAYYLYYFMFVPTMIQSCFIMKREGAMQITRRNQLQYLYVYTSVVGQWFCWNRLELRFPNSSSINSFTLLIQDRYLSPNSLF